MNSPTPLELFEERARVAQVDLRATSSTARNSTESLREVVSYLKSIGMEQRAVELENMEGGESFKLALMNECAANSFDKIAQEEGPIHPGMDFIVSIVVADPKRTDLVESMEPLVTVDEVRNLMIRILLTDISVEAKQGLPPDQLPQPKNWMKYVGNFFSVEIHRIIDERKEQ